MIATLARGVTVALSLVVAGCGRAPLATGSGHAPLAGTGIPSNGGTYYIVYRA